MKRTITISGSKFEVDTADLKEIKNFRVGDPVKLLKKEYSDQYASYAGVVAAYDDFENLPTITIVYITSDYNGADVKFAYLNSQSKDMEIAPLNPAEKSVGLLEQNVERKLQEAVTKKAEEYNEAQRKLVFFRDNLKKLWEVANG